MITAYAILKKAAAQANHASKRLGDRQYQLNRRDLRRDPGRPAQDMFPLHVWMTGSGTQFNMNVNEVISNRCASRGHAVGKQDRRSTERPRQHGAVVERLVSLGDVRRGGE